MIITILIDSNLNITFIKRRFSGTFPLGVGLPAPFVLHYYLLFRCRLCAVNYVVCKYMHAHSPKTRLFLKFSHIESLKQK